MLSLLLDENISPKIARQIIEKRSDIRITSISERQGGYYESQPDETILTAALHESFTLVTYDQRTILPVLVRRFWCDGEPPEPITPLSPS